MLKRQKASDDFTFTFAFSFVTCLSFNFLKRGIVYIIPLLFITLLECHSASAQTYKIRGFVYDSSRNFPLEAVSVLTTSGKGTVTNAVGFYEVEVAETDSIWFSYLNKPTMKFPVLKIVNPSTFDVSLQVNVPILREVKIRQHNYRQDSTQNRLDYAKIFDYHKPRLKAVEPEYGAAMGFDLDAIVNMFRFRHNKNLAAFQKRLLQDEKDKYVDHRFNKAVVRRLTQLDGKELDSFMIVYRPSYSFTLTADDYDFFRYIKVSSQRFERGLPPLEELKPEEPE